MGPSRGLLTRASDGSGSTDRDGSPCGGAPARRPPSCQARRCRRRVRTATTGRTRTPSIGLPRALRSERARHRHVVHARLASPRTLSLAASPVLPRQGRAGRFELPRAPAAALPLPARRPRSLRRRCVSPTSATDSRHEHPAVRSIPGCALVHAAPRGASLPRAPTHPGREPRRRGSGACRSAYRMSRPGGASLDGEPPASAWPQPSREPRRASARSRSSVRPRVGEGAVLAEPRSTAPPRPTSRRRSSRPRVGLATRPLASSSCPSADPASLPCPRRLGAPGPAVPPPRQRRQRSPTQDAFHRRVLPPPDASALARLRVGSRGARHRCRCSRAGGFRHRDPASGAPSPAELARVSGEPAG